MGRVRGVDADVGAAVEKALAVIGQRSVRGVAVSHAGGWRGAALAEAVDRDPGYAPSPRSRRGAARA